METGINNQGGFPIVAMEILLVKTRLTALGVIKKIELKNPYQKRADRQHRWLTLVQAWRRER